MKYALWLILCLRHITSCYLLRQRYTVTCRYLSVTVTSYHHTISISTDLIYGHCLLDFIYDVCCYYAATMVPCYVICIYPTARHSMLCSHGNISTYQHITLTTGCISYGKLWLYKLYTVSLYMLVFTILRNLTMDLFMVVYGITTVWPSSVALQVLLALLLALST